MVLSTVDRRNADTAIRCDGRPAATERIHSVATGGEKEDGQEGKKKKGPPPDDYSKEGHQATEAERRRADKFGDDHRATLEANGSEDGSLDTGTVRGGR